ncbi:MAG: hypothetical protein J6W09_05335 [Bacteroidales bacterium]|nr:hypothetical protein [Bacteroidales bacterium]
MIKRILSILLALCAGTSLYSQDVLGEQMVDLGLSVRWAGYNIGASSPEETGGYYAWGETFEKEQYRPDTYTLSPSLDALSPAHDVAHLAWGGSWRIPTGEELKELREKCKWEFITYKGMDGFLATGPNGRSIFLPCAGIKTEMGLRQLGHGASYYSSTASLSNEPGCEGFYFYAGEPVPIAVNLFRYAGFPVRAVWDDSLLPVEIPFEREDHMPDFSRVGYRWGDVPIPDVKTVKRLRAPKNGQDATEIIQKAIDGMKRPGAILLGAGIWNVSGSIHLDRSGVVIRGEGKGKTVVVATGKVQRSLFEIGKRTHREFIPEQDTEITEDYVPLGRLYVQVAEPQLFKPGDRVVIWRPATPEWIHAIRMDQIKQSPDAFGRIVAQWKPEDYDESYERIVMRIDGNRIYLDNPVVMALDKCFGGGRLRGCRYERVEECGIEDLSMVSEYNPEITAEHNGERYCCDEEHGWKAVEVFGAEHCWIRRLDARHFGYAMTWLGEGAKNITVEDCHSQAPVSLMYGARRYSFGIAMGQLCLVKDCSADNDRHGFVTQAHTFGPNAYVRCRMTHAHDDAGPHHRWTTGTLYDCVSTDNRFRVQDRGGIGYGHGWAGGNIVLWNCESNGFVVQDVWESANNYAIGCVGKRTSSILMDNARKFNLPFTDEDERPDGIWVSEGTHVSPVSLYDYQMGIRKERNILVK